MAEQTVLVEQRWCTPCNALRMAHRIGYSIGWACNTCGSGRVRPPLAHELPKPVTKPPPVGRYEDD